MLPEDDNEIPQKHSRSLQVLQSHLQHATRQIKTRPDPINTDATTTTTTPE